MRRTIGSGVVVLAVLAGACGGGGSVSGPSAPRVAATPAPGATPAPAATDVSATWRGNGRGGGAPFTLTWTLKQEGSTVTGISQFVDQAGFTSGHGKVTGTVSGSTFTFTDEYPSGALANPGCAETDSGTLTISGNRMEGTFRSASTCGRIESGNLSLAR